MSHRALEANRASRLTLCALSESAASSDVIAMIVEASADSTICDATYLPPAMNAAQAKKFCSAHDGFVIRENGAPAGVLIVHMTPRPGDGVKLPPGCVEIERWALQRFRGRGVLRRAWPALTTALATRFQQLAAVCWEDNHAAAKSLRACGFARKGRSFWTGEGESGWCEVYVYDLQKQRATK